MAINVTIGLSGSIQITDNSSGSVAQTIPVLVSYVGAVAEYYPAFSAASGGTAVSLPISPVQFVYLKNTSTTIACSATWTKTGGGSQSIITLDPGAAVWFCENGTSNGITALTLTAASSTTAIQMVLAG